MNESELLEQLDRRAAEARGALHAAASEASIPELEGPRRSARRRTTSLVALAAAVVLLVALAFSQLGRDDDNDETMIAGEPKATHLVLPDPAAAGYELSAAFDGSQRPDPAVELPSATLQGPESADDPWASVVLEYALVAEEGRLTGEVVDIGGPSATVVDDGTTRVVSWVDDDLVRFLASKRLNEGELIALAAATVAAGSPPGTALPGQQVLYSGRIGDLSPYFAAKAGVPSGVAGVAYALVEGGGGFAVTTVPGSDVGWRASHATAASVSEATVRGHDAVVADFGPLTEVSWLEDDDTLVRVDLLSADSATVLPLLDELVPIDRVAFAELVRASPTPDDGSGSGWVSYGDLPTEDASVTATTMVDSGDERFPDLPGARPLAEVALEEGGVSLLATVLVDASGSHSLQVSVEGPDGGVGSGSGLQDIESGTALRQDIEGGDGVLVAGLIGPSVTSVEIRDPATGRPVEGEGPSTATIEGSEHVLFMGRIGAAWSDVPLLVVGTMADGTEVPVAF